MIKEKYDVIIIGSGAGGGTVAEYLSRFADRGISILIIEGGPYWDKEKFNQNERDMSKLYFNRGAVFSKEMNIGVAAAKAVGGSTVVYTGVSFRPPEDVLERWRKEYGLKFLTEDFVNSRLDEMEKMINVHEIPPEYDNDNNILFKKGCEKLGIKVKRLRINIRDCKGQGFCNLGCTEGAKQGTHVVQIPLALSRGVDITYNSWVNYIDRETVYFTVNPAPPWTRKNVLPEGSYSVKGKVIIIAAGALNTPALFLRSRKAIGIKNSNIGRYITLHPAYNLNGVYPEPIKNYRGHPKSFYVDQFSESENYYLETSFYFPGVTAKNNPGFGKIHEEVMKKYNHMMSILILSHDPAEKHNRIEIDRRGTMRLRYRVNPSIRKSLAKAIIRAGEIFFAAGCTEMLLPGSRKLPLTRGDSSNLEKLITEKNLIFEKYPLSSAHPQGGARMGEDPEFSVVSPEGTLWGTDNIYVADASLFPTSVKVNPYETVMLMARYVGEQVKKSLIG